MRDKFNRTYGGGLKLNEMEIARNKFFSDLEACGYFPVDLDIVAIEHRPNTMLFSGTCSGPEVSQIVDDTANIIAHRIETAVNVAVGACESRHATERAKLVAEAAKLSEEIALLQEQLEMVVQISR